MNLLTRIMEYLRTKCEEVFIELEKEVGKEKLITYLSDAHRD